MDHEKLEGEALRQRQLVGGGMFLTAAAAMIGGALLPWVQITSLFGSIGGSGVDRGTPGYICIGIGVGLGGIGLTLLSGKMYHRTNYYWNAVLAAGAAAWAWYDATQGVELITDEGFLARYGLGVWVVTLGALAAWGGAERAPFLIKNEGASPPPPPPPF